MEDINIKSIRYPVTVDEKIEKLALKFGRTKRLLFIQMVDYFYKSKKDPTDLNDDVLKKEIANGISRIISFVKKQENDFLLPFLNDIAKLIKIAYGHTKYMEGISQYALQDQKWTKQIILQLDSLNKDIAKTQTHLNHKIALKNRFKEILDYYIASRELIKWHNKEKKENLQDHVRKSLENL